MATMRDENRRWTREAKNYINKIEDVIEQMLEIGEDMGFSDGEIFAIIVDQVHYIQSKRIIGLENW